MKVWGVGVVEERGEEGLGAEVDVEERVVAMEGVLEWRTIVVRMIRMRRCRAKLADFRVRMFLV